MNAIGLLFGPRCTERDTGVLFVEALDTKCTAEIEEQFVWQLAQVTTNVLKCQIGYNIMLSRVLS